MKKTARDFISTLKANNPHAASRAKKKIRRAMKEGASVNRILRKLTKAK